jgi:aryl-phospho-beta-D-glucosidase BglC (GH1 family)
LKKDKCSLLRIEAGDIIDSKGRKVNLRGVNLGGWLMMEGYFLHGRNIPEHLFKKEFKRHNGAGALDDFCRLYRKNFVTAQDIRRIREMGANCVRVPFNYRLIENEKRWDYLDDVILWCKREGIYCILDLHAAPGAQNQDWHSDSDGRARLWKESKLQQQYFSIWRRIARRYKEEAAVAGYDILNEPVVDNPQALRRFYRRAVKEIRKTDKTHIIFLEANLWGQQLEPLGKPADKNTAYSIHFYQPINFTFNFQPHLRYPGAIDGSDWNSKHICRQLASYYRLARQWQVPVYVGEFGINFRSARHYGELRWLKDVLQCFKRFSFHWTYWTYKAVAGGLYPDGIYQYLPNSDWVKREGPVPGWENFYHLWKGQKAGIAASWKTGHFTQNPHISRLLARYF